MIIGLSDGTIQVYHQNKTLSKAFRYFTDEITFIRPLPNDLIAFSSKDYSIKILYASNWSLKLDYSGHSSFIINGVNGLEYANDEATMVSSGPNGLLRWDFYGGKLFKKIQRNSKDSKIYSLCLLPNVGQQQQERVVTGGELGRIKIWNLKQEFFFKFH